MTARCETVFTAADANGVRVYFGSISNSSSGFDSSDTDHHLVMAIAMVELPLREFVRAKAVQERTS